MTKWGLCMYVIIVMYVRLAVTVSHCNGVCCVRAWEIFLTFPTLPLNSPVDFILLLIIIVYYYNHLHFNTCTLHHCRLVTFILIIITVFHL